MSSVWKGSYTNMYFSTCVISCENPHLVCADVYSNSLISVALSSAELKALFSPYDLKRLEMYSHSMVDYHLIMDMIPTIARMYFLKQLGDVSLSAAQCVSSPTMANEVHSKYNKVL